VRRGSFQPTGAFEDISLGEVGQPIAQKWSVAEGFHQSPSQLAFGFARGSGFERRVRSFGGDPNAHSTHDSLDEWNCSTRYAQRAHAEADERKRHERLRRHLTTHSDLKAMRDTNIHDSLYQGENCGMQRRKPGGEICASTIYG